jgi:DNA modification methylase
MCDHAPKDRRGNHTTLEGGQQSNGHALDAFKNCCLKCGAIRFDQQIGLEASPQEFIATLVAVFREVRRVLRKDGTCWINMGDSYAGSWGAQGRPQSDTGEMAGRKVGHARQINSHPRFQANTGTIGKEWGLKPKDKMLMPHRLAIALCDDGWWIRDDIVWNKKNPMPESARDRCTKAHEFVFLLARSQRYYFDADAIAEPASENTNSRRAVIKEPDGWDATKGNGRHGSVHKRGRDKGQLRKLADSGSGTKNNTSFDDAMAVMPETRNKRSVWTIASEAFPEAHFATFPTALVEPCILAGCPGGGTVLDPFFGAGTTGLVADRHHRHCIGIELNPVYADLAFKRIAKEAKLFTDIEFVPRAGGPGATPQGDSDGHKTEVPPDAEGQRQENAEVLGA